MIAAAHRNARAVMNELGITGATFRLVYAASFACLSFSLPLSLSLLLSLHSRKIRKRAFTDIRLDSIFDFEVALTPLCKSRSLRARAGNGVPPVFVAFAKSRDRRTAYQTETEAVIAVIGLTRYL